VTPLIREQRVGDRVLVRERAQDLDGIVADREERDLLCNQRRMDVLQLDQLRLAERSPLRASVENDDGFPSRARLVDIDHPPHLVRQPNIGETLAFIWPDLSEVPRW